MGCLSACRIQQEHKGPATLVFTWEALKGALRCGGFFLREGVHSEMRAGSLQRERDTGLWSAGETSGTVQPDCGVSGES